MGIFQELVLFLIVAGLLVPAIARAGISPVMGYLALGCLIGPFGLARLVPDLPWLAYVTIPETHELAAFGELGVIFLLFMIGLELSFDRLRAMRRLVWGLGGSQLVLTALALTGAARLAGVPTDAAIVLGLSLSLSSTAIVTQLLIEQRRLATPLGQSAFSILLLQDLAVVPILFLVGQLASPDAGNAGLALLMAMLRAVVVIGGIYAVGRLLLRPLFRMVGQTRNHDMFMATCMLVVLGTALMTGAAGLSMSLGAFIAGLLLAETEFRHQVETIVSPFKGLLLGLFFLTVGMDMDFGVALADPVRVALAVIGLYLIKALLIVLLALVFRLPRPVALETGLLLGQASEFAFVAIRLALGAGVVEAGEGQLALIAVTLSMILTPGVAALVRPLAERLARKLDSARQMALAPSAMHLSGHVVIAGYGRVGQMVSAVLEAEKIAYVALDFDARAVAAARRSGLPVFYGDASRLDLLRRANLEEARALVLTMNNASDAALIHAARAEWPDLPVLARAHDEVGARWLLAQGATHAVPETREVSLQLAGMVLEDIGVPPDTVRQRLDEQRDALDLQPP